MTLEELLKDMKDLQASEEFNNLTDKQQQKVNLIVMRLEPQNKEEN